ncbi:MAG: sodium-dependent transporter [Gammaproteobacteria bacterium]|nr:sodium-dependent transporter [Gammaproteobacteria bacterium]
MTSTNNESWSGRLAFILASIGAAVGLGNIWKFPYTLGSSGGSAFVLVYVIAILLVATPIMLAEMIIGRRARRSAPAAMENLAVEHGASRNWRFVGWMGLFALFLVLSFYSVIAGWTAAYLFKTASGAMSGLSPAEVGENFGNFLHEPWQMIFWHLAFTVATVFVVSKGVRIGLERLVKVLMPALLLTLVALVINSAFVGDFSAALDFLFTADLSKLTPVVVLAAVGQAFFSVNVGVGAVLTYSAYLPKEVNLFRSAIIVALGDTMVALLAGLAIFPIVFANNLDPGEGPGLIFVTLSTAFAQMPGGVLIGTAFFAMLIFAALTSSISMLESMTARIYEIRGISRTAAAGTIGAGTFLVGLITVLSFSTWENTYPLGQFAIFAGKTPFDLIDYLVSNVLMPLGGMLYALFAGWWLSRDTCLDEIGLDDGAIFRLWLLLVRVVAPLGVAAVFVFNLA